MSINSDLDDLGVFDDDFENADDFLFEGLDVLDAPSAIGGPRSNNNNSTSASKLKSVLDTATSQNSTANAQLDDDLDLESATEMVLPKSCMPKVTNVVGSVDVGCPIPLKTLSHRVKNTEYNPKRFSATTMRIRNPKATANIFANGKIVVTGAQDEEKCRLALRKFVRIVRKAGIHDASFNDFKIHNVVAHCNVGFPVKIEALALKYQGSATYEPELFPGVIWKCKDPRVCVIIYVSGEMIFTGAKTRDGVFKTFEKLYPRLLQFIKTSHKERIVKEIQEAQNAEQKEGTSIETPIELD